MFLSSVLPDFKKRLFSKSLKTAADLSVFAEKFDTEPRSHKTTTENLQHFSLYNYKIDKQRETSRSSIAINVKYDWSVA